MALVLSGSGNGSLNNLALSANTGTIVDTARAGGVIQVKSSIKTDTATTTGTSFADISDLSVSITPTSTSNKILILLTLGAVGNNTNAIIFNLVRGSTTLAQPDGGTNPGSINVFPSATSDVDNASLNFLDSPSTTSATTYKVQWRVDAGTGYLNRHTGNTNYNSVSTITVMEVVA